MRRLLITRRDRVRKKARNPIIIRKEPKRVQSSSPKANPRTRWAAGVRGNAQASVDTGAGSSFRGEEDPAEEPHGSDEEGEEVIKAVYVGHEGGYRDGYGGEHQPNDEGDRYYQ